MTWTAKCRLSEPHRHICKAGYATAYDRAVLMDVLVYHYRDDIKGCGCGWAELGKSWPEHVATVYEESVTAHGDRAE